jgi:hypothetical protein
MARGNGNGNGKDLVGLLVNDVEELKALSRAHNHRMELLGGQMESLSDRMNSISETMAVTATTMGLIAKAMSQQSAQGRDHERLYGRLAKTLIAFKATTDHRFGRLEKRVERLERSSVRH